MLKYKIEGYSTASMEDALGQAMTKAAAFCSEDHDMHVAVLELTVLPGRGFKALVEVTIIPISFRETLHREAADIELKRLKDEDYRARKKFGEEHLGKEVDSHFLRVFGATPDIPNVYLVNLTDSQIKNYFIEKNLYHMFPDSMEWNLITDLTVLKAIQSALESQEHHHVPYDGVADHALKIDNPALEKKVEAEFDHAVHPEHAAQPAVGPKVAPVAPGKRPNAPGLREDEEL
jgi:hypothetical protein